MAVLFHFHLPTAGWAGKALDYASHHVLQTLAVAGASIAIGGSFGAIMLAAAVAESDLRFFIMILPHAMASTLVYILFLAGIFSLKRRDP